MKMSKQENYLIFLECPTAHRYKVQAFGSLQLQFVNVVNLTTKIKKNLVPLQVQPDSTSLSDFWVRDYNGFILSEFNGK